MAKRVTFEGVTHEFPDDATDAEVAAALGGDLKPSAPAPKARTFGDNASGELWLDPKHQTPSLKEVGANSLKMLPMLGAAAATGGLAPGASIIGRLVAAGLGGAGGAGTQMLSEAATGAAPTPGTARGVLRTMGEQGAGMAAAEGVAQGAGSLMQAGAKRVYQGVAKPSKILRAQYPTVVEDALAAGTAVTHGGADKAEGLIESSKDAADALVAAHASGPNPTTIDPRQAVGGITRAIQDVKDLPVARPQMKAIGDYGRQYLAEHPSPLSLPKAQQAVRATDKFFNPQYRATIDRSNPITSGQAAAGMGINDETRQLLRKAVPGLQAQNAETSKLVGVKDMIAQRVGQQGNLSPVGMQHLINAGLGGGAAAFGGKEKGIGTFMAMEALTNPAIASHGAIGLSKVANQIPWDALVKAAILGRLRGNTSAEEP
jgi:hypothetical protein